MLSNGVKTRREAPKGKWLVNFSRRWVPFLPFIITADAIRHESNSLHLFGLTFSIERNWNDYVEATAKSAAEKFSSLQHNHFFIRLVYIKYYWHISSGVTSIYLEILENILRKICSIVGSDLTYRILSFSLAPSVNIFMAMFMTNFLP